MLRRFVTEKSGRSAIKLRPRGEGMIIRAENKIGTVLKNGNNRCNMYS